MALRTYNAPNQREQRDRERFALYPSIDRAVEEQVIDLDARDGDRPSWLRLKEKVAVLREFSARPRARLEPLLARELGATS